MAHRLVFVPADDFHALIAGALGRDPPLLLRLSRRTVAAMAHRLVFVLPADDFHALVAGALGRDPLLLLVGVLGLAARGRAVDRSRSAAFVLLTLLDQMTLDVARLRNTVVAALFRVVDEL